MENITYDEFIQNILETRGRGGCGEMYYEKHHILPKCMGGTDEEDNLIDLFATEHFVAHKLLALENPENEKLQYAWWCMCSCKEYNGKRIYDVSPEDYEESRIRCIDIHKNRVISEEEKRKQKELTLKGKDHPWYGKHHTEETKQKISEARKGKYSGKNHPLYGKLASEETRRKMRENHTDVFGENNPRALIILQFDKADGLLKVWRYVKLASQQLKISASDISRCAKGKLKSAGGYQWKYLYDNKLKNGEIIPGSITLGIITEEEALKLLEQDKMINK